MRQQIPSFRLPESVIDEECGYILDMGVTTFFNHCVESMKALLIRNTILYLWVRVLRVAKTSIAQL